MRTTCKGPHKPCAWHFKTSALRRHSADGWPRTSSMRASSGTMDGMLRGGLAGAAMLATCSLAGRSLRQGLASSVRLSAALFSPLLEGPSPAHSTPLMAAIVLFNLISNLICTPILCTEVT